MGLKKDCSGTSADLSRFAVIFDLDGVLVSSDKCHFEAWKQIADELKIPFDENKNHLLRGVSRRESLMIILKDSGRSFSEEEILELMDRKNALYLKKIEELGRKLIIPGAEEFLSRCRKLSMKTALVSGSRNARSLLEFSGLGTAYFDVITDASRISNSKPDPEGFLTAVSDLGVKPENCIVIEDAPAGVEAARRAGMFVMGVGDAGLPPCDIRHSSLAEAGPEDFRTLA